MKFATICVKALAAITLFTATLGGVAIAQADPLVVALPVNSSDYKTIRPLIEQWSDKTGHSVKILETNTSDYSSTYVLAAHTGSPHIDVVAYWDFYTGQFYHFLVPLDGSADPEIKLGAKDKADFIEAAMKPYRGHIYILPYSLDTRLLYYRKDLLKEAGYSQPPETWNELVEVAQKLTQDTNGDGVIDQWGFATLGKPGDVFNTYTFFDFLFQAGGQIFNAQGEPAFDSQAGVKALQFMVDLRNKYKVMPPDVTTYSNSQVHTGFLSGKFAMVNHWPYLMGMVRDSDLAGKVGYAKEPILEGGSNAAVFNAWGFGIMKMSDQKKLAFDLIKYLTSKQAGIYEFSHMLDWPLRKSVYDSAEARENVPKAHWKFSQLVFDIANNDGHTVRLPRAAEVAQILGAQIDRAMLDEITPKQALDTAAKKIKNRLQ